MRDLLFKNIISADKKRRVLVSQETSQKNGVLTSVQRKLVCLVKEMDRASAPVSSPQIVVVKERNNGLGYQRFFCRMKGQLYAVNNGHLFLIIFSHSLKINLRQAA